MGDFLPVILTTLIVHYTNLSDANMHSSSTIFQSSETKKTEKTITKNPTTSIPVIPPRYFRKNHSMFVAFQQTHLGKRIIDLEVSILRLRELHPISFSNFTLKKLGYRLGTPKKMVMFGFFLPKKWREKKRKTILLREFGLVVSFFGGWGVVTFFRWKKSAIKLTTSDGWWNVSSEINMDGIQMSGFR